MRRHLVAACAASLLTLAACAAEATAPAAEAPVDRELETIRISVMGMG
jgi:hypothetical protein